MPDTFVLNRQPYKPHWIIIRMAQGITIRVYCTNLCIANRIAQITNTWTQYEHVMILLAAYPLECICMWVSFTSHSCDLHYCLYKNIHIYIHILVYGWVVAGTWQLVWNGLELHVTHPLQYIMHYKYNARRFNRYNQCWSLFPSELWQRNMKFWQNWNLRLYRNSCTLTRCHRNRM